MDFLRLQDDIRRWQQALKEAQEHRDRVMPLFVAWTVFMEVGGLFNARAREVTHG